MNKKYFWIGFVFGCVVFIITSIVLVNKIFVQPDISINQVEVINLEGESEDLTNYLGKPLVINYWATWCKPCVEELPYFEELNKYAFGKPMKVVLVSLDFKKQLDTKLITFMNEFQIQSDLVVLNDPDSNRWISEVDENWSGAIPVTLVYNAKHRLFLEMTFEDFTQIKNIVEKFNNES